MEVAPSKSSAVIVVIESSANCANLFVPLPVSRAFIASIKPSGKDSSLFVLPFIRSLLARSFKSASS
jgi:hypothetical protein